MRPAPLLAALLLATALPAIAQTGEEPAPRETPAPAPSTLGGIPVHLSLEVRERYDNPELPLDRFGQVDTRHGALAFFWSRIRIGLLADPLPRFRAFAEVQDSRFWGEEQGTLNNIRGVDLHQGWLQFGDGERLIRIGRQEYALGEERLFGRDDWYEAGRVFDMLRIRSPLAGGRFLGELLYAETTNPLPDNQDEAFELLALTRLLPEGQFVRLYAVEKHESHRGPRTGNKLYIVTLGLHGHVSLGPFVLDLEAAGQAGERYDDNQRAAFLAGYVRRSWGGPHPVTLGLEFSRGSGDGDDGDGNSRNIDVLYPSRHDKYGLLDLLSLQNNRQGGVTLDVLGERPGDSLHVAVRLLAVDDPKGAWINARGETIGRDPTGRSGRTIGWELDVGLRRRVFRQIDLDVALEGGYLRGGELARSADNIVQAYEGAITLSYRFGR